METGSRPAWGLAAIGQPEIGQGPATAAVSSGKRF